MRRLLTLLLLAIAACATPPSDDDVAESQPEAMTSWDKVCEYDGDCEIVPLAGCCSGGAPQFDAVNRERVASYRASSTCVLPKHTCRSSYPAGVAPKAKAACQGGRCAIVPLGKNDLLDPSDECYAMPDETGHLCGSCNSTSHGGGAGIVSCDSYLDCVEGRCRRDPPRPAPSDCRTNGCRVGVCTPCERPPFETRYECTRDEICPRP